MGVICPNSINRMCLHCENWINTGRTQSGMLVGRCNKICATTLGEFGAVCSDWVPSGQYLPEDQEDDSYCD